MIHFAVFDAEGLVIGAGSNRVLKAGAVALPDGVTAMAAMQMMLRDGLLVPRPVLTGPTVEPYDKTGLALRFAGLPAGTVASVVDTLAGYQMAELAETGGLIGIELPDTGLYRIEVTPPRPWLPLAMKIEVPA